MNKPIYETKLYKVVVGKTEVEIGNTVVMRDVYKVINKEHGVTEQATHELHRAIFHAEYLTLSVEHEVWNKELDSFRRSVSAVSVPEAGAPLIKAH